MTKPDYWVETGYEPPVSVEVARANILDDLIILSAAAQAYKERKNAHTDQRFSVAADRHFEVVAEGIDFALSEDNTDQHSKTKPPRVRIGDAVDLQKTAEMQRAISMGTNMPQGNRYNHLKRLSPLSVRNEAGYLLHGQEWILTGFAYRLEKDVTRVLGRERHPEVSDLEDTQLARLSTRLLLGLVSAATNRPRK